MPKVKQRNRRTIAQKVIPPEETEVFKSDNENPFQEDSANSSNKKRKGDDCEESYDVEYLLTKVQRLEDQLKEKHKEALSTIHLPESIDIATLEKLDQHHKVIMTQLKEFAAEMAFPRKTIILNKNDATALTYTLLL